MKIGFFTDTYLPVVHGVEISIETFRQDFEKMGHEVYIYAPHTPGYKDKNLKIFRLKSVKVIEKPEMRFALPIVSGGKLKELIDFKLDIVHAHTPFSMGILGKIISARQKIPMVYTHHTDYPEYSKAYLKGKIILPAAAKSWSRWFSNMADTVIAPSYKIKKLLKSYGVKKPIYILPTGIDLKSFKRTEKSLKMTESLKKKLGVLPEEKLLIFVGRMGKEKNVDFLIKSFGEILRKGGNIKLMLVGDGPHLGRLKLFAKKLKLDGNIIFTGSVPHENLPVYYQVSDLFVFSSLTETQGIVVIEAMASGLPVVALDDDAFRGAVIDDRNGFLIKRNTPKMFAEKTLNILTDKNLRNRFSKASLKIAKNFSREKQAKELIGIYKKMIKFSA